MIRQLSADVCQGLEVLFRGILVGMIGASLCLIVAMCCLSSYEESPAQSVGSCESAEQVVAYMLGETAGPFEIRHDLRPIDSQEILEGSSQAVFETPKDLYQVLYEPPISDGARRRLQIQAFPVGGSLEWEIFADTRLDCEPDYGRIDLETFDVPAQDADAMQMFFSNAAWVDDPVDIARVGEENLPYWEWRLDRFYADVEPLLPSR